MAELDSDIQRYHVAEKTDGQRYYLLISNTGLRGAWLVDRNMQFHPLVFNSPTHRRSICAQFAGTGVTLVDGEVAITPYIPDLAHTLFGAGAGVPTFVAFDIICLCGNRLGAQGFSERSYILARDVVTRARNCGFPLHILAKQFSGVSNYLGQLDRLKTSIICRDGVYCRHSPHAGSLHRTDGIVVIHPGPYVARGEYPYSYKWKFEHSVAIDVVILRNLRKGIPWYALAGGGSNGKKWGIMYWTPKRPPIYNLVDLINAIKDWAPNLVAEAEGDALAVLDFAQPVFELTFDRAAGMWRFITIRDKATPNHSTIIFETMEEIAEEHVSFDELFQWLNESAQIKS